MSRVKPDQSALNHDRLGSCRPNGLIDTHSQCPEPQEGPHYQAQVLVPVDSSYCQEWGGGAPQLLNPSALLPHQMASPRLLLCSDGVLKVWGEAALSDCCETTFIEGLPPNFASSSAATKEAMLFTDGKFMDFSEEDVKIQTLSHDIDDDDEFQELESDYSSESESEDAFLLMPPRDHLGLSVFSMLCCFWPLGIAAFYLSHETNKAVSKGDFHLASSSSRRALFLAVLSITIGTGIYVGVAVALIAYLSKNHHW
uniref:Synapse differentiation-inducing gene protein 1 n=1 Tax=Sphaeramia orbicularis TaxID=375764 RepID=A0A673C1C5_9TELE